ncbi:C2 NT-type domain-containing protein [Citrus sinensis]|uniref:C2 NT-type domain-containing protein n=1 Tax=Citrus sinensis TaxID=2711 RepID=A0ACB8L7M8_CITSI|nr:C2 NT-type domain-containing protein [Citrus sinensis]
MSPLYTAPESPCSRCLLRAQPALLAARAACAGCCALLLRALVQRCSRPAAAARAAASGCAPRSRSVTTMPVRSQSITTTSVKSQSLTTTLVRSQTVTNDLLGYDLEVNSQDEDWIYHRNCNLYYVQNSKSLRHSVNRRILPWRKRKLSGDQKVQQEVDHHSLNLGVTIFRRAAGKSKEVISRDGNMKLPAQVSLLLLIKGACAQQSEFHNLITKGSFDWRNLCENEEYIHWFPDKHFDLETVLEAQICPLFVVPKKSFVVFFNPEGLELGRDHSLWKLTTFIDTLEERLYEGCNQAYILKFDKDATIKQLPKDTKSSEENNSKASDKAAPGANPFEGTSVVYRVEKGTVYRGNVSCNEYIKSFLAAIPVRELHTDIRKGLMASTPLHHRLQVEFHYTRLLKPQEAEFAAGEVTNDDIPAMQASLAVA